MEDFKPTLSILDIMERVDPCALAILDHVPFRDLARSERVCRRWQELLRSYSYTKCCNLSLHHASSNHSVCNEPVSNHRRIDISLDNCSPSSVSAAIEKWGGAIRKVTIGHCVEKCFEVIVSHCTKLEYIECHNLSEQSFPINQIKNCKKLKKITLRNFRQSSEHDLSARIVECEGIEFNNIDIDMFGTEDFIDSIKSINLKSLSFVPHGARGTATVRVDGADLTLLGVSPNWHFFMFEAKHAQIYQSLFHDKIKHILQPL